MTEKLIVPMEHYETKLEEFSPIAPADMYQLNDLVSHMAPWSVSKAKMAQKCPTQFRWNYLDKKKPDAGIETKDQSVKLGSTMHLLYENHLKGDTKKTAYVKAVKEIGLSLEEQKAMKPMVDGISWFTGTIKNFVQSKLHSTLEIPELIHMGKVYVEERFALTKALEYSDDFFNAKKNSLIRGVIDMIILTADNGAIIIDHKSATYPDLRHFKTQLKVYAAAVLLRYPQLEWVQCGVHFMSLQDIRLDDVVLREDLESLKRGLYYFMSSAANEVLTNELRIGNHCKWCAHRDSCKTLRKTIR